MSLDLTRNMTTICLTRSGVCHCSDVSVIIRRGLFFFVVYFVIYVSLRNSPVKKSSLYLVFTLSFVDCAMVRRKKHFKALIFLRWKQFRYGTETMKHHDAVKIMKQSEPRILEHAI